jgi:hypothetical protein
VSTSVRATFRSWSYRPLRRRLLLANSAVAIIVFAAFWGASRTSIWWYKYIPGPDKYVEVIATGAIAAAFTFYLQRLTSGYVNVEMVVKRFQEWLPGDLRKHIDQECSRYRVDPDLVEAIVITEWAQRPPWIRRLEDALGLFGLSRTYGVMQASRKRGASDIESISVGVKNLAGAVLPRQYGNFCKPALVQFHLERHNRGAEFSDFATGVLFACPTGYAIHSPYVAHDGRAGIRAKQPVRDGETWIIEGDIGKEIDSLTVWNQDSNFVHDWAIVPSEFGRRTWKIRCTVYDDKIMVQGVGDLDYRPREPRDCTIEVNL